MAKANETPEIETAKIEAARIEPAKIPGPFFSKEQLLRSERYSGRRDLLNALLDGEKQYTISEVDTALNTYLKGKVK